MDKAGAMKLLNAAAVLGGIDEQVLMRMKGEYSEGAPKELKDSGILRLAGVDGGVEYRLSIDIIGDYLRCMVMVKEDFPGSCNVLLEYFKYAPERVRAVVHGLAALQGNSLMMRVFPGLEEGAERCIRRVVEEAMERVEPGELLSACAAAAVADALTGELVERLAERVRESRHPSLARPLFSITSAFLLRGKKEGEVFLKELTELYRRHRDDKEVRAALAMALSNAVGGYARANELKLMEKRLEELRELYSAHPEKELRVVLAKALNNAVGGYARANECEKAEGLPGEIEELFRLGMPATGETLELVHVILKAGPAIVLRCAASSPELSSRMLRLVLMLAGEKLKHEICSLMRKELDRLLEEGRLSAEAYRRVLEPCNQRSNP